MIGRLIFPSGIVATLFEDGHWECPEEPMLARSLRSLYEDHYRGPSDGQYGHRLLAEAARDHGATFTLEAKRTAPPGTIY